MVISDTICQSLCASSTLNNHDPVVLCNKGLSSQDKVPRSRFPHLDSAVSHNRPTETDMYMQHPISRAAKDITA